MQKPDTNAWISIFEVGLDKYCDECHQYIGKGVEDKCIFVGRAAELIGNYKTNTGD